MDIILLRNFHMRAVIGPDAWNRSGKAQPLVLTVKLLADTRVAGNSDEIVHTFSYGQMCKDVTVLSDGQFRSIDDVTDGLAKVALANGWPGESLQISLTAPKALLRVEGGLGREVTLRKKRIDWQQTWSLERQVWLVRQLKLACIIGVNPHERLEKQQVTIDLQILGEPRSSEGDFGERDGEGESPWTTLVSRVCSVGLQFCRSPCQGLSCCGLITWTPRSSNRLNSIHWKHSPL